MSVDTPKVAAEGVKAWFGDNQILKGIDMKIPKNQVTAIIGPSGCGKSTFIRCINRMHELVDIARFEGKILLDKDNVYESDVDPVLLRRRVGMVFQKPNPFPTMSIRDNVLFSYRLHEPAARKMSTSDLNAVAQDALETVLLWDKVKDRLDRKATELSLEEQQKLCIARLLPVKPSVLLMDEPCSALDPAGTEAVEELIWELRGDYTILIVTHNMAQARRASDECVFMLLGKIIEHAPTDELFVTPRHKETADYIEGRYG